MAVWESFESQLYWEETQRREEGCDTSGFRERIAACKGEFVKLAALYDELDRLPLRKDFPYREPDGGRLEELLVLSDASGKDPGFCGSREDLYDRMYGAWLGRCIGCALGKPLEVYPFVAGRDGKTGYEFVLDWLKGADAWPLESYIPGSSAASVHGFSAQYPASQREHIRFMETDDDIRYLLLALLMGERKGNEFTPDDVAVLWQEYLPVRMCFTAELQAYINSLNAEIDDPETRWEYYRSHHNPYREWIGAQIRVDHYAYANAGSPFLAAKVAWQDARFSHAKNGVYGAMFVAAAIAAAFNGTDPEACVETGLSVVPKTSRLYEAIREAVAVAKKAADVEMLYAELWKRFGHYSHVHTINNAACCAAALVFGKGDFTRTVTTAVCCGWDTDCNGATVGSLMGALLGAKALPTCWTEPLHDTLYSALPDFHPIAISACAHRSIALYEKLHPTKNNG